MSHILQAVVFSANQVSAQVLYVDVHKVTSKKLFCWAVRFR